MPSSGSCRHGLPDSANVDGLSSNVLLGMISWEVVDAFRWQPGLPFRDLFKMSTNTVGAIGGLASRTCDEQLSTTESFSRFDIRVIAATHRDLRAMMLEGQFREYLYYRLSMVELRVPSLAERKEDLPLLARHFIKKSSAQFDKSVRGLTRRAGIALSRYDWPGNVRELENAIGHACMMIPGDTLDVADLPAYLRSKPPQPGSAESLASARKGSAN
jgi:Sigma-54 interaction domain